MFNRAEMRSEGLILAYSTNNKAFKKVTVNLIESHLNDAFINHVYSIQNVNQMQTYVTFRFPSQFSQYFRNIHYISQ